MSVGVVVALVVVAIMLFKVATEIVTSRKEHKCDGNCGCDGNCEENCKCKDK